MDIEEVKQFLTEAYLQGWHEAKENFHSSVERALEIYIGKINMEINRRFGIQE